MTTTGRLPEQPQQPQTATEHRPDGDRSAPAVARIQGAGYGHVFVDEIRLPEPGTYELHSRLVSGVWEHTVQPVDLVDELMAVGRQIAKSLAGMAQAAEEFRKADLLVELPPTDPKARALWLRQHRNTGPTQQRRAPRRLDTTARRGRRSSW